jgi:myo-inositol-1(or 4)-monophosphatase
MPNMKDQDVTIRVLAAEAVARQAGKVARRYYDDRINLAVESKGVQDLVSIADRAVEDLIVGTLGGAFPGDTFLGEEGGATSEGNLTGDRLWVIDPIDGTANFLRGIPHWAVSIAYMVAGEVEIGVAYDPMTDELYSARRGGGATCDGTPIRVSDCTQLDKAMVGIGFSYRRPPALHGEAVEKALSAHCEYRRTGGGTLGMTLVADGRLEGYWEPHINAWDVLAGYLILREAGGWTNDFLADDGLAKGNPIVACAPGIKDALIDLIGVPDADQS